MRIGSARRQDEFEINVIPLIDVILTLLMFFVLTTTFVNHAHMQVSLPSAERAAQDAQANPLTLMIDRDGRYFIDNNEVLKGDVDSLKQAIGQVAGADRGRRVLLRADARTPHQAVVTAMDAIGQLGFEKLSIATLPGDAAGSAGTSVSGAAR